MSRKTQFAPKLAKRVPFLVTSDDSGRSEEWILERDLAWQLSYKKYLESRIVSAIDRERERFGKLPVRLVYYGEPVPVLMEIVPVWTNTWKYKSVPHRASWRHTARGRLYWILQCVQCGGRFPAKRKDAIFCSDACRKRRAKAT